MSLLRTRSRILLGVTMLSCQHSSRSGTIPTPLSVTTSQNRVDKGKGRADAGPALPICPPGAAAALPSLLDEALHSSLPLPSSASSSVDSSWSSPPRPLVTPPPKALHPVAPLRPTLRPRLVSQLTRATLPTSSLTYASAHETRPPWPYNSISPGKAPGESSRSVSWHRPSSSLDTEWFPDLDPETGLPIESGRRDSMRRDSISSIPSLHLQRTITDLVDGQRSSKNGTAPSLFGSLPRFPLPMFGTGGAAERSVSRVGSQRSISTTAAQQDWSTWASTWWKGNKDTVDRLMSDEDVADTVEEEQEHIHAKYQKPKNPLVFCHGLLGFDYIGPASLPPLQISHWRGIREVLESNGVEVLIARVPATSSIKDRATILQELIEEKFPNRSVNLVAHSMGGLDCRYLISQLPPKTFKVASLTTISTPHRGSPFADYVIDNVIGRERLPQLLSVLETMRLPDSTGDGTAFNALGTKAMKVFNAEVIDRDDVKYYSWGASFEPGILDTFRWPHSVILTKEGPNDGLVSVHSAMWGEYRGTLLGVNHLDLVGWVNHVRYALSGWTGNPIAFKPATFYLEISDYLAEQGF